MIKVHNLLSLDVVLYISRQSQTFSYLKVYQLPNKLSARNKHSLDYIKCCKL